MNDEDLLASAIPLTFATDTLSITVMESVDNPIIFFIPGAMDAGLWTSCFGGAWRLRSL